MISLPHLHGRSVAVLGLGRSGLKAAQALLESGAKIICWDDLEAARNTALAAGLPLKNFMDMDWSSVDVLVIGPGIPHTYPAPHPAVSAARAGGLFPVGDINCFFETTPAVPVIGVTGTNGKSTTSVLITHLLSTLGEKALVGGNIGIPVLELPVLSHGAYVLELSSYQLELTPALDLDVSVLLNISPDHLERYAGLEGYTAAKKRILQNASKPLKAVIGVDSPLCADIFKEISQDTANRVLPISCQSATEKGVSVINGRLEDHSDTNAPPFSFDLSQIATLKGKHNHQNAAASYAALRLLNFSPPEIVRGFESFPGLAHRQEQVAVLEGITYVNDSKATNAEAALTAIETYADATLYLILGGRPKEGGLSRLQPVLPLITHAFLIGEAASDFGIFCSLAGVPFTQSETLSHALQDATTLALQERKPSPVVLLSPACASFDQFPNFEARGNAFRQWVRERSHVRRSS